MERTYVRCYEVHAKGWGEGEREEQSRSGSKNQDAPHPTEKEPNPPPIILPAAGVALGVKPSYVLPIMFIIGLGTAAPPHRYTQAQCWDAVQTSAPFAGLNPRSRAILKKVLTGNNGIATRHLALEKLDLVFDLSPDALHSRFSDAAPGLAVEAARRALADAGTAPSDIDAVVVSTCTGYLCPGLTSYVSERLGLRSNTITFDLVGQG